MSVLFSYFQVRSIYLNSGSDSDHKYNTIIYHLQVNTSLRLPDFLWKDFISAKFENL